MIKVMSIKNWLEGSKHPPLVWQRVLIKALPELNKEKLFLHTINDETELPSDLYNHIRHILIESFKIDIPEDFQEMETC